MRLDEAVRDQPDHPEAHRLGLAGAGTGDHDVRLQRRRDSAGLLGGGRVGLAEPVGELGRGEDDIALRCRVEQARLARRWRGVPGHAVTVRPSSWTGQLVRTGQRAQ